MTPETPTNQAWFSPRATLGIALFLLAPELLRAASGSLEPFPAVVLPAGAGKVRLPGGRLPIKHTLVEGQRNGVWHELDRAALLAPLPVHYFGEVVRGSFGFHDGRWRGLTPPPPRASPLTVLETKRWLRARLQKMGFDKHAFRVVEERYVLEVPSGNRRSVERLTEKTYELD